MSVLCIVPKNLQNADSSLTVVKPKIEFLFRIIQADPIISFLSQVIYVGRTPQRKLNVVVNTVKANQQKFARGLLIGPRITSFFRFACVEKICSSGIVRYIYHHIAISRCSMYYVN